MQLIRHKYTKASRSRGKTGEQKSSLGWLLLAATLMFATMLAQQSYADKSRPHPQSGALFWTDNNTDDAHYPQALHLGTAVTMDVKGLTAAVTVKQTFSNNSDSWQEGVYVFPLPENSAVNRMTMTIGERVIKGSIAEKAEAKRIYSEAKRAGKKAALVEQERPNLFTQSLANIAPGENVEVELRYLQTLTYDHGTFSLRFPMTLTPRYIPGKLAEGVAEEQRFQVSGTGWAMPTAQVPDASRITPRHIPGGASVENPVTLAITLDAGYPLNSVTSPTHSLKIDMPGSGVRHIQLAGNNQMDRDFELRWRPQVRKDATAALFHEQRDGDSFLQLMLLPPPAQADTSTFSRELVMVVDTSGSMAGPSIVQAKQSLLWALKNLAPQDKFNIIAFASSYHSLSPSSVPASEANINKAQRFVNALEADGGTEMAPALRAALPTNGAAESAENHLKQVVFITDGAVGNEAELFRIIDNNLGNARLFTVGIGAAPNSYFMRKSAEFGRGAFTYIGDPQQVEEQMGALFDKLSNPVMAGIKIHWGNANATEVFPATVPDLYQGEPLLVDARIPGGLDMGSEIAVFGQVGRKAWRRYVAVPQPQQVDAEQSIVATQWARAKIEALEDEKLKGRDPQQVRQEVLKVALPFQLLSAYTSFVAVEQQPSRPSHESLESGEVLNHLPAGQSAHALVYPQTATNASFHFFSGLLLLLLLWVIRRGLYHE